MSPLAPRLAVFRDVHPRALLNEVESRGRIFVFNVESSAIICRKMKIKIENENI